MVDYDEKAKCPKCGSELISTHFNPAGWMERKCGRCGYWWHEEPLDKKQVEEQPNG